MATGLPIQALSAAGRAAAGAALGRKRYSRLSLKSCRRRHRTTQVPSEESEQRKLADHRGLGTSRGWPLLAIAFRWGEKAFLRSSERRHSLTHQSSARETLGYERDVLASEAKTVGQNVLALVFPGCIRHVVQIAVRIGCFVVHGRRHNVVP